MTQEDEKQSAEEVLTPSALLTKDACVAMVSTLRKAVLNGRLQKIGFIFVICAVIVYFLFSVPLLVLSLTGVFIDKTLLEQSKAMQTQIAELNKTYSSELENFTLRLSAISKQLTERENELMLLKQTFKNHTDNVKAIDENARRELSLLNLKMQQLEKLVNDLSILNKRMRDSSEQRSDYPVEQPTKVQGVSFQRQSDGGRLRSEPFLILVANLLIFCALIFS